MLGDAANGDCTGRSIGYVAASLETVFRLAWILLPRQAENISRSNRLLAMCSYICFPSWCENMGIQMSRFTCSEGNISSVGPRVAW